MWKVLAIFNELLDGEEEETSIVTEKVFDTYLAMRDYVTICESQGAVGGMVMRYHPRDNFWEYYMDVQ